MSSFTPLCRDCSRVLITGEEKGGSSQAGNAVPIHQAKATPRAVRTRSPGAPTIFISKIRENKPISLQTEKRNLPLPDAQHRPHHRIKASKADRSFKLSQMTAKWEMMFKYSAPSARSLSNRCCCSYISPRRGARRAKSSSCLVSAMWRTEVVFQAAQAVELPSCTAQRLAGSPSPSPSPRVGL